MILKGNNPDDWRIYYSKCKRDENVKASEEEDDGEKKFGDKKLRQLQEDDLAKMKAESDKEEAAKIVKIEEKEEVVIDPSKFGTKNRNELFMTKVIPI